MNPGAYLQAIRSDGQAALDAARKGLDPPVPTTPGWTVGDVIAHLGQVHRQKTHIVRELIVDGETFLLPHHRLDELGFGTIRSRCSTTVEASRHGRELLAVQQHRGQGGGQAT